MEEVQRGISGRWTLPVVVGEMRHIVPTIAGLPLELGLCGAVVAQAAANGELGKPEQLPHSNCGSSPSAEIKSFYNLEKYPTNVETLVTSCLQRQRELIRIFHFRHISITLFWISSL